MLTSEALAIACGLSSAITWGAGDFSGGYATKKSNVLTVILYSQIIGALLLIGLHFIHDAKPPELHHLVWGALAGICGALGLIALYKGLAIGRMGIVAPVSAVTTALIPVIFALFTEGLPKNTQLIGFAGALAAVWLFSSGKRHRGLIRAELVLSLLAGIGFSLYFICIDHVSHEAILWPLTASRLASISLITAILAAKRQLVLPKREHLPAIALAGIFDTTGNAFFALASQLGRLDVSAILASMYPASTVLLARCFLKERLGRKQSMGLLAACVALALIAA